MPRVAERWVRLFPVRANGEPDADGENWDTHNSTPPTSWRANFLRQAAPCDATLHPWPHPATSSLTQPLRLLPLRHPLRSAARSWCGLDPHQRSILRPPQVLDRVPPDRARGDLRRRPVRLRRDEQPRLHALETGTPTVLRNLYASPIQPRRTYIPVVAVGRRISIRRRLSISETVQVTERLLRGMGRPSSTNSPTTRMQFEAENSSSTNTVVRSRKEAHRKTPIDRSRLEKIG